MCPVTKEALSRDHNKRQQTKTSLGHLGSFKVTDHLVKLYIGLWKLRNYAKYIAERLVHRLVKL